MTRPVRSSPLPMATWISLIHVGYRRTILHSSDPLCLSWMRALQLRGPSTFYGTIPWRDHTLSAWYEMFAFVLLWSPQFSSMSVFCICCSHYFGLGFQSSVSPLPMIMGVIMNGKGMSDFELLIKFTKKLTI